MTPDAFLARIGDGRVIWVAVDLHGRLVGFAELGQDGHIDCFYCHPARQGIGRALFLLLEAWAKAHGIRKLSVEASEGARPFFLRMGFSCGERREICRGGEMLHNWAMAKPLLLQAPAAPALS
ncbi:GNAT family N-acetyltransferase [Roseovarius arcticus]|uniref:GNAT family N-acetyltransferase n=1 Tax=Roseovarius arcticus TaxID=2547404 RepID=UPI001FEA6C3E|nr:GNAT family N-acetyltransferase [Roseovarius arcticus]